MQVTRRIRKYNRKSRKYRGGQEERLTITKVPDRSNMDFNKEYFLKLGNNFDTEFLKGNIQFIFYTDDNHKFKVQPEDELYFR
jgi:hypothetical protein